MSDGAPLRILHLEDDRNDRELVAATLRGAGMVCDIFAVDSRDAFIRSLEHNRLDVILADDRLPAFDGQAALALAAAIVPKVPFIVVSGTLGEEIAVERLKSGAIDYVLKQRLARLPASIERAIREVETREERARAEREVYRLNAELEQRVADRTTQLESANEARTRSESRMQAILDHSPSIICLKDLEGRYLLVNRHFEQTFNVERASVLGKTDHDLFPPRLADVYRANDLRVLRSGKSIQVEEAALHDGVAHLYSASKFALIGADGTPYAMCAISSDITKRKQAEDDIKVARLEAERANRAKSEFLSRMSHDLRTPLNAVLGFAQLLSGEPLNVEQRECVDQILKGGQHLLDLINEVLDIARIEAGRLSLSPEPVNVREIIEHAVALVAPLRRQRNIAIHIDESNGDDLFVFADRQRLNQILLNLLSNAVKYNRANGRVAVAVERVGTRLRIKVTDTGAGIPPEKLQYLFRPFERLGAETTAVEGTGLGLALSRGLAEAMGGVIDVVSTIDQGSTFWVELAIADASTHIVPTDVSPQMLRPVTQRPGLVLYVEDNRSNVRLIERVLERRPAVRLMHAATAETGMVMARELKPDVIFLDLHLPDLTGEEMMGRLWEDPELRRIPVVVLTADATPGQMRRLIASGARAYLTKPLDVSKVLDVLDGILASVDGGEGSPL